MTNVERGSSKDMYLGGQKRTSFEQRSGLPPLKSGAKFKREFTLQSGRKVEAEHVIINADKVAVQTVVHELNPRNQDALDENSMRDILRQIQERGVDTEGVAVKRDNKYYLIEGSRRRYCCIKVKADLPLWVLPDDLTTEDVNAIINAAQSSRKFSYREVGKQYLEIMASKGYTTNDELAQHVGVSAESIRKRVQAAQIDERLIMIFPDCEGIPNTFYSRLAKIQKEAEKNKIELDILCAEIDKDTDNIVIDDIPEKQRIILEDLIAALELLTAATPAKGWKTVDLVTYENKDKYARISRSANGRKVKIEFNRINQSLIDEIERLIVQKMNKANSTEK
ncbi:ParB family protein [Xenorhabdus thailandensis]|uniref:ParB family protein n=1 Tax=Xenorhabdus thailandensis TaxID=3136255 RepID=UPI0030F491A7